MVHTISRGAGFNCITATHITRVFFYIVCDKKPSSKCREFHTSFTRSVFVTILLATIFRSSASNWTMSQTHSVLSRLAFFDHIFVVCGLIWMLITWFSNLEFDKEAISDSCRSENVLYRRG